MIALTLPYPVSANRYWSSRVIRSKETGRQMAMTYVTPEARAYREEIALRARAAGIRTPMEGRIWLHLQLYPHRPLDWQKRVAKLGHQAWDDDVQCIDLGNAEKVLADALQGIAFADDKQIWRQSKERMEPDGRPARVVVVLRPCPPRPAVQQIIEPLQLEAAPAP